VFVHARASCLFILGLQDFFLFFFKVVFQGLFWIVFGKISGLFFGKNFGDFFIAMRGCFCAFVFPVLACSLGSILIYENTKNAEGGTSSYTRMLKFCLAPCFYALDKMLKIMKLFCSPWRNWAKRAGNHIYKIDS